VGTSVQETLPATGFAVAEIATPTAKGQYKVYELGMCEVMTDKGYHSGAGWRPCAKWACGACFGSPAATA
jgi:hypothetical protein